MTLLVAALVASSVALLCVAGLVAWRWLLDFRRWSLQQKADERDAALAELAPRVSTLEKAVKDLQYARAK